MSTPEPTNNSKLGTGILLGVLLVLLVGGIIWQNREVAQNTLERLEDIQLPEGGEIDLTLVDEAQKTIEGQQTGIRGEFDKEIEEMKQDILKIGGEALTSFIESAKNKILKLIEDLFPKGLTQ